MGVSDCVAGELWTRTRALGPIALPEDLVEAVAGIARLVGVAGCEFSCLPSTSCLPKHLVHCVQRYGLSRVLDGQSNYPLDRA